MQLNCTMVHYHYKGRFVFIHIHIYCNDISLICLTYAIGYWDPLQYNFPLEEEISLAYSPKLRIRQLLMTLSSTVLVYI